MSRPNALRVPIVGLGMVAAILGSLGDGPGRTPVHAQTAIYINDMDDPTNFTDECETPADRCTLRGALGRAVEFSGGLIIRACFDPTVVPGAEPCPTGVRPLGKNTRGYDAAKNKWVIRLARDREILLAQGGTFIDFRLGFPWQGPQDNRVVIESSGPNMESAFHIGSQRNALAGFELRGSFREAAIYVPGGVIGDPARLNQFGPGLIFAGMPDGAGVKLSSDLAFNNTVVGNWCGITGDGTVVDPVFDDCVVIDQGAHDNIIGDLDPSNRNVFAASTNGGGVLVEGPDAVDNAIQGNWFGMLATGKDTPTSKLNTGVQLILAPQRTKVQRNVISGNARAGIYISDAGSGTEIDDNWIGTDPQGVRCIGNKGYGISLQGGPFGTKIRRNTIRCNSAGGILMTGASTRDNLVSRNSISANKASNAVTVIQGANRGIQPPKVTEATRTRIAGTACPMCAIEVYSDPDGEAETFEGNTVADGDGNWTLDKPEGIKGPFVTAIATDGENSSGTSAVKTVSGGSPTDPPTPSVEPTATATATATSPDPTPSAPSPTVGAGGRIFLPWSARGALR